MTITITLPPSYDFPTADECALYMTDATTALERRLKPKIEHGLIKQAEADYKLHLYRSITSVLDAVLAAMEDTEQMQSIRRKAGEVDEPVPPEAVKPSETKPDDQLICHKCGFNGAASDFMNGRKCPVPTLQADFFSCPECYGFDIRRQNEEVTS